MFIVYISNTAIFKLIPLMYTHVYSYMFSIVHPPETGSYTKYDIWCHIVFNVTIVILQVTLLMNKGTIIVMDDGWISSIGQNPTFSC